MTSSLVAAILANDRPKVTQWLRSNAGLAVSASQKQPRFHPEIMHWIYAGDTALHVAAAAYCVGIARLLLAEGADPNASKNHRRGRPLHYAADGHLESPAWNPARQKAMIRLLIDKGADLNAQDKNGATPLHRAVRTRCASAVKCLLRAGADAGIPNLQGSTPFHLAVQNTGRGGSGSVRAKASQREIIQTFLSYGLSPMTKDGNGKSVLEWAKSDTIRQLLQ